MIFPLEIIVFFAVLSLLASIVNGGLGYGYSSISTPVAILVLINRIINPAFVLLEAMLNTVMLALSGRANIRATFRRALPVMAALVPGVIIGSLILNAVAPLWIRFIVYAAILPMILLQAGGFRRPIRSEGTAALPLGFGIGLLYSITTISGPPIALFWNNQGLAKKEFKAAIAQVRITESYLTCLSYYLLGLFTASSISLFTVIAPPVLIGIPLGMFIVQKVAVETFRRLAMTFDAGIVGYGLSTVMVSLFKLDVDLSYIFWVAVLAIDIFLFYRFFIRRKVESKVAPLPPMHFADGGPPRIPWQKRFRLQSLRDARIPFW